MTPITIWMKDDFAGTLDVDTTFVTLWGKNISHVNGTIELDSTRSMYISEVNNEVNNTHNKSISIRFPGAVSGEYQLNVSTTTEGRFDSSNLKITTVGEILDIQPRTGSAQGGTNITITGRHFSTDPLDNNVNIGYPTAVQCLVWYSDDT